MAKPKQSTTSPARLGNHHRLLGFARLSSFDKAWSDLGMDDDDLQSLERMILDHPGIGAVMEGTGGLRKARFASSRSNRGKSGAVRVCYALFPEFGMVFLILVFGKGDKANLDASEKIAIKRLLTEYEAALRKKGGR